MKEKILLTLTLLLLAGERSAQAAADEWKLLFSLQTEKGGAPLSHPVGLYVDGQAERYYVADSGHDRLVSFDKSGRFLHAFNAGKSLQKPIAMIKRGDGRLLVLEKGEAVLTEIDLKTREVVPHRLLDQGREVYPQRLKAGEQTLYLLDKASGGILLLDQGLKVKGRLSCPECQAGYADFAIKGGAVYALPLLGAEIHVFDVQGALTHTIPLSPAPEFPVSLALGPDGGFLVLERHANTVVHYHGDGRLLGRYLGPGHKEGSLSYPAEIQVDPWGRVCIVDEGNGRVGVFKP